ncbi:MAG TPA: hypothetical protein VFR42_01525, partial [Candidatus Acidoferrum sp.]|nr:hypothetical protein [Candidatus Acidoferrum sp.]
RIEPAVVNARSPGVRDLVDGGRFDARRRALRKIQSPETRRGREELNTHTLAAVAQITEKHDAALDLFLSFGVGDRQELAIIHFVFQHKKPAVRADHQGLARLAEFFAIVSASLRLHLHFAKDASAAPGSGKLDRGHHAFIIEKALEGVNWPAGQVYRIKKRVAGRLVLCRERVLQ